MKAHFACLFGVDRDKDMIPHWIPHYLSMGFNSYMVYVHSPAGEGQYYVNLFRNRGMNATEISGEFYTGNLRARILSTHHNSLSHNDWLFTVDSDEIFDLPVCWRDMLEDYDVFETTSIERWADGVRKADPFKPLSEQYPLSGYLMQEINPDSVAVCTKILGARRSVRVDYTGSHVYCGVYDTPVRKADPSRIVDPRYMNPAQNLLRVKRGFRFRHYCWRDQPTERMINKWYYRSDHVRRVMEYFGLEDDRVLKIKLEEERMAQAERGWIGNGASGSLHPLNMVRA